MNPASSRIPTLALAMLMLLMLPNLAMAATFTDSSGQQVSFTKPFSRIISLYSAHSENMAALGAADKLIGIGREEDFPPEILDKDTFSYREDAEKFLAAAPDLVLVRPMIERSYPELLNKLRRVGITVVSLQPNTVEEIFAYWRQLGLLVGREEAAELMIADFSTRKERVRGKVASIPVESRPKVYFEAIHAKMKTFATDSIAMYVLEQAGGNNIAADAPQVRQTNIADYGKERLLARGEEIDFFVAQRGRMNPISEKDIIDEPGFGAIRAVRQGRIVLVPEALVSRPTPRLAEGIELLHHALYPSAGARP
jgi:iron complex transport system substrate-binding protein